MECTQIDRIRIQYQQRHLLDQCRSNYICHIKCSPLLRLTLKCGWVDVFSSPFRLYKKMQTDFRCDMEFLHLTLSTKLSPDKATCSRQEAKCIHDTSACKREFMSSGAFICKSSSSVFYKIKKLGTTSYAPSYSCHLDNLIQQVILKPFCFKSFLLIETIALNHKR